MLILVQVSQNLTTIWESFASLGYPQLNTEVRYTEGLSLVQSSQQLQSQVGRHQKSLKRSLLRDRKFSQTLVSNSNSHCVAQDWPMMGSRGPLLYYNISLQYQGLVEDYRKPVSSRSSSLNTVITCLFPALCVLAVSDGLL